MITADAKEAIRTYLLHRNPIRALVGGRIYPGAAPQGGDLPRITIEGTGLEQMHHMTGASKSVEADYEINVYSHDDEEAHRVAAAISVAMNGLTGKLHDLSISYIRMETQNDETLPPADGGEDPIYNVEQSWKLWYSESVPSFPAK